MLSNVGRMDGVNLIFEGTSMGAIDPHFIWL
jgi:hypothetical protein